MKTDDRLSERLRLPFGQRLLRLFGGVILAICAAMVVLGVAVWDDELQGPLFAVYWGWCFLLALIAIVTGLWDLILVRRSFQQRRRELFRQEFMTDELVGKLRDAIHRDEQQQDDR